MKQNKQKMVYLLALRENGKVCLLEPGGCKKSFKIKYISYWQTALKNYKEQIFKPNSFGRKVTFEIVNSLPAKSRNMFLNYFLGAQPVCLALPVQEFDQLLNEGFIYPNETFYVRMIHFRKADFVRMDLREDFVEKYRIYDIGRSMEEMVAYYETGILHRLDREPPSGIAQNSDSGVAAGNYYHYY